MRMMSRLNENFLKYLGPALLPEADYAIYAWISFAGVKFLLILKENYEKRDEERIANVI